MIRLLAHFVCAVVVVSPVVSARHFLPSLFALVVDGERVLVELFVSTYFAQQQDEPRCESFCSTGGETRDPLAVQKRRQEADL
jgi:hypothetical protein